MRHHSLESLTDADLVLIHQGAPERDDGREAVAELLSRHRDRLYTWCFRQTGDHDRALDLSQETFLAALRGLSRFEGRSEFSSWLFAIARKRYLSGLRGAREDFVADFDPDSVIDPDPGPAELLVLLDDEQRMLDLIQRILDPEEQVAVWMRCYEGVSVEEITRLLQLESSSGARGMLQRARRKLRAALPAIREGRLPR